MTMWRQGKIESDADIQGETLDKVNHYFGSVEAAGLGLFMSTTGGISWVEMYEVVVLGGGIVSFAYLFFIGFFGFAVITILSGIFIEKALAASQPDREAQALEQRRNEESECEEMRKLIQQMDADGSGSLTLPEFVKAS